MAEQLMTCPFKKTRGKRLTNYMQKYTCICLCAGYFKKPGLYIHIVSTQNVRNACIFRRTNLKIIPFISRRGTRIRKYIYVPIRAVLSLSENFIPS